MNEKVEKAINEQINAEFYSAYLYLSMSAYFSKNGLSGFASWMYSQYQEENMHGMKFYNIPEYLFKYRMNDKYIARKSFKYRMNEFKIKTRGYKYIRHPWYKYHMALLSLILAFIPPFIFIFLKRFDPR